MDSWQPPGSTRSSQTSSPLTLGTQHGVRCWAGKDGIKLSARLSSLTLPVVMMVNVVAVKYSLFLKFLGHILVFDVIYRHLAVYPIIQ